MKASLIKSVLLVAASLSILFATGGVSAGQVNTELREINQLSEQGNQAAALDRINSYLANNTKTAEAMFMRGVILVEMGKRDEAIKAFTEVTEKYPELPEPYNNLAVLYADQGQYDKARKALEAAIKTHPSYATAHENLGDIYARLASEAYDKALKLDTSNARAQNKLAMIRDLFGGAKKAVTRPITPAPAIVPAVDASKKPVPPTAVEAKPEIKPEPAKPEVKPEPVKPTPAPQVENHEKAVLDAVNAWADAWADKRVDHYLASYAKEFKTPNNEPRKEWERVRKERIAKPAKIFIKLNNLDVQMQGDAAATVYFKQSYKSGGLDTSSNKTLSMVKEGGRWLIKQERVGRY